MDSRSVGSLSGGAPLVVLPVGAVEAHGPHLPLEADRIQAERTADELAARMGGYVAPTLGYGVCTSARRFPGTLSLSLETVAAATREILSELGRHGFRRIVVLSGHAESVHMAALRSGADAAASADPRLDLLVLSDYDFVYERRGVDAPLTDGHAGLLETSRVLHLAPSLVGPFRVAGHRAGSRFRPGPYRQADWPESVDGDPSGASAELGARVQAYVVDRLVETCELLAPRAE